MLSKLDILFSFLSLVAFLISRFDPNRDWFWMGVVFGVIAIIGNIWIKIKSGEKKKEEAVIIEPTDWNIQMDGNLISKAELWVRKERHGKGDNINVRIKQLGFKKYDFEEPEIENGNILIRYSDNNFPDDPRIPLNILVSGRG
jgi:hypothetical protein